MHFFDEIDVDPNVLNTNNESFMDVSPTESYYNVEKFNNLFREDINHLNIIHLNIRTMRKMWTTSLHS